MSEILRNFIKGPSTGQPEYNTAAFGASKIADAYLGFSILGENKTDFSVAMAGGLVIGMRGRTPILMAGAATLTTIWV